MLIYRHFPGEESGPERIIQVQEARFEPRQADPKAHPSNTHTFRVVGKTKLTQNPFGSFFPKVSILFLFIFFIFNYKITHIQYRKADKQIGTKIIHPLSCLTVANTLVFILPDIFLYMYMGILVTGFSHLRIYPW